MNKILMLTTILFTIIFLTYCGSSKPGWVSKPDSGIGNIDKQYNWIVLIKLKDPKDKNIKTKPIAENYFKGVIANKVKKADKKAQEEVSKYLALNTKEKDRYFDNKTKTLYVRAMVPKNALQKALDKYYGNSKDKKLGKRGLGGKKDDKKYVNKNKDEYNNFKNAFASEAGSSGVFSVVSSEGYTTNVEVILLRGERL